MTLKDVRFSNDAITVVDSKGEDFFVYWKANFLVRGFRLTQDEPNHSIGGSQLRPASLIDSGYFSYPFVIVMV